MLEFTCHEVSFINGDVSRTVVIKDGRENQEKDLYLVKCPTYPFWEICAFQQPVFYSYTHWTWFFQKRDHLHLLYRLTSPDFSYTWLILFPPSASQWPHPSLRLSGHCPTSRAPMSCGLRCSPNHITGPTMRPKAAEGLSKLQLVATLSFRYGLEFFSFWCPSFASRWATSAQPLPVACWVVVCVSASYLSDGWETWDGISIRSWSSYSEARGESLPELDKDRNDILAQATSSLLFLMEKLLDFAEICVLTEGFCNHYFVLKFQMWVHWENSIHSCKI